MGEVSMGERTFAVLGLFPSSQSLLDAIPGVKAKDLGRLEAYTPYPVHGIENALGLRNSPLAGMVLVMGILGAISAMIFELWTSAVDYPVITGGKAPSSWEAFVPVMFEVMVFFATFTAGLGMLFLLNRLPFFRHPVLHSQAIRAITRDKFALSLEVESGTLDADAARTVLEAAGAESVEVLPAPESLVPISLKFFLRAATGIVITCIVVGFAMYWGVKIFPVLPPMAHMQEQPKLNPQRESGLFDEGFGMRLPVAGTVARGYLPYPFQNQDEAAVLANPLPRTKAVLELGKKVYQNHCTVCHGPLGDGEHRLGGAYGAKPANLHTEDFRNYPDGKIYHAIVAGKNSMPSYAAELPEEERWAAVHYVRALQRSQNARDEDVR